MIHSSRIDCPSRRPSVVLAVLTSSQTFSLPPRKAPPPPHSPRLAPTSNGGSPPPPLVLHSTISPLTPSSPIYPDGILTPLWISKHQSRLPAVFMTIFTLTSDPNKSSLRDNQLKSEINNVRNVFASTNYKTKLVVVLLGEHGATSPLDLDERLSVLRRATSLDTKTLFFLPSGSQHKEVDEFATTIHSSVQSSCIDYYRDLSKHARRKRNRSTLPPPTVPPTSGTSQVLPSQGWNVRYEFKLGVFAEFRQEMEAAARNYESAYEGLFAPELLESISSWNPLFNEARLLVDIMTLRIIRCQLWNGHTTAAVKSWLNHLRRMQDLIDRRGKGTGNYGWEAWEATWSKMMAQLVGRAEILTVSPPKISDPQLTRAATIYALPEKGVTTGERLAPWELLHHEGYWLKRATRHVQNRRTLALQIPEEDRASPGHSPASVIANKAHLYDTYLTLEPHDEYPVGGKSGFGYSNDIVNTLQDAGNQFSRRNQDRASAHLQLEMAKEHMQSGSWQEAINSLRLLWSNSTWRQAGWWDLLQEVGWSLRETALQIGDAETVLRVEWELHSRVFTPRHGHNYSFNQCLNDIPNSGARTDIVIKSEEAVSCVSPTLSFATAEGNVGEPLSAQLCLKSLCQAGSEFLYLSEVKVVFEGSLRSIRLLSDNTTAKPESAPKTQILNVRWRGSSAVTDPAHPHSPAGALAPLVGLTDLSIGPKSVKVFNLTLSPREPGDVKVVSITLLFEEEQFSLAYVLSSQEESEVVWWDSREGRLWARRIGRDRDPSAVKILPKPPKMQIKALNIKKMFYTNELLLLQIELLNEEEDAAIVTAEARLISPQQHHAKVKWANQENGSFDTLGSSQNLISLPPLDLGLLARSSSLTLAITMTDTVDALDHELEVVVRYYLESEPDTPLNKVSTFDVSFMRPFEANYEFLCRYDSQPWPNFFDAPVIAISSSVHNQKPSEKGDVIATGITQNYALIANIYSFATEDLVIEDAVLAVQNVLGNAVCHAASNNEAHGLESERDSKIIRPDQTKDFNFLLNVQKLALADRHSVGLDLALHIRWRRVNSDETTMSTLELPRYVAPMVEPRVLLISKPYPSPTLSGLRHLTFVIENPSMHFLTFNLTMESSEDFAFSGPKATNVSLVPLSRYTVEYRILSSKTSDWVRVNLAIVDPYFGKTLKVNPANEFVRSDKKNNVSVWID